jgi:hypothetical protein
MAFAYNPDDRPARLIRYVEPGTLPTKDLMALYDKGQNLLIIDRAHFEKLSRAEQNILKKTHEPFIEVGCPRYKLAA